MSFLFKAPSMPTPPPLEMPKTEDVPSAEDAARKAEEAENMRRRTRSVQEIVLVEDLRF